MKTSTLLLLLGGAGAGYYLYNRSRTTAPAPAVTPMPASIVDTATGVIQQIVKGISAGAVSKTTVGYESPPFNPKVNTLSGTCLEGDVFRSKNGLGSLG